MTSSGNRLSHEILYLVPTWLTNQEEHCPAQTFSGIITPHLAPGWPSCSIHWRTELSSLTLALVDAWNLSIGKLGALLLPLLSIKAGICWNVYNENTRQRNYCLLFFHGALWPHICVWISIWCILMPRSRTYCGSKLINLTCCECSGHSSSRVLAIRTDGACDIPGMHGRGFR